MTALRNSSPTNACIGQSAAFGADSVFRSGAPDTIQTCDRRLRRVTLSDRLRGRFATPSIWHAKHLFQGCQIGDDVGAIPRRRQSLEEHFRAVNVPAWIREIGVQCGCSPSGLVRFHRFRIAIVRHTGRLTPHDTPGPACRGVYHRARIRATRWLMRATGYRRPRQAACYSRNHYARVLKPRCNRDPQILAAEGYKPALSRVCIGDQGSKVR